MRSPSARVLDQAVDYYAATVTQDASGGVVYTYGAPTLRGLACSAQPGAVEEVLDAQGRLIQERQWKLVLAQPTAAKARDKFVWTDRAGATHTAFAHVERDEAGRGSTYVVRVIERT